MTRAVNEAMSKSLAALGFTGATPEQLLKWLQDDGAVSDNLPTAWKEMLIARGISSDGLQINEGWYELLGILGQTGAYPERVHEFWSGGGVLLDFLLLEDGSSLLLLEDGTSKLILG